MASFLNFDVGGRPYNSQDFAALQGVVIDTTQIYGAFVGNYIINGCTTRGGAGSIWLNGKIRAVEQDQVITNATPFPLWLVEQNTQLNRLYRDGQSKVAFNVFSAVWSTTAPVSGASIQFNSQSDLTTKTLKQQLTVDALPTSGGTFSGDITVIDSVRTISAYGSPIGTVMFGSSGPTGDYQTGIGFNHIWNGTNYVNYGDTSNNMSGAIVMKYTQGNNPIINFLLNPTTNGSDRFLSNVDVNNSIKMTLTSAGNLTLVGALSSNAVGTNSLTINKVGTTSTIYFPAQTNDPGFIQHYENNNNAIMTFSASDDFGNVDYFSFQGGNQEGVRIYTNGISTFKNTMTVQGNVNAVDFIANGNSLTTAVNNAINTANSVASTANTALSTANAANSAASTAQSTANSAQSTANTANSTANSAQSTANTAQSTATTANNTANSAQSTASTAQSTANTALANANAALARLPSGVILMWSGSQGSIPSGWVLCNGGSGTPDLRDRFIVGAGNSYGVNATGGANFITLGISEIPSHRHAIGERNAGNSGGQANDESVGNYGAGGPYYTDYQGGGGAHENRPPYWALCYIMKT